MTPATRHKIARLEAAAVVIDGVRVVRQAHAMRILTDGRRRWPHTRDANRFRRVVTEGHPGPSGSRRQRVYLHLEDCIADAARRDFRPWTAHEDDQLLEAIEGRSLEYAARQLGRSRSACQQRLHRLGLTVASAGGWLTTGDVARLVGHSRQAIQNWCSRGLPVRRMKNRRGDRLICRDALCRWLRKNPEILAGIGPLHRRRLKLSVHDLQEQAA
jgi:hypothetical protein